MSQWWKKSVIYEILVPSFQDSNGDGIGDIRGIEQRLPYLVDLGIGALWLSPIYRTEFFDVGYDVSDYRQVDPRFGTLEDFKRLLEHAHALGLKLILDFVPNHTSKQHAWFLESRSSRDNPYRNYYLWSDPAADGGPPNNWINRFGASAWTFDEATGQYYFGTFAPEQPDLNWRNPAVQREMSDVLQFWLGLGCDGVRVDALAHLIKDQRLRRNPRDSQYTPDQDPPNRLWPAYSQNQPELLTVIHDIKQVIAEFPERVFVGEAFQPAEQLAVYIRAGADVLLNTSLLQTDFNRDMLQVCIDRWEATIPPGHWPAHMSGDHDLKRLASRLSEPQLRPAALLFFTVRGTAAMYYGEELGLEDAPIPKDAQVDPSGRSKSRYSRDPRRVPMPWTDAPNGGFTDGKPWLPLDPLSRKKNVAAQLSDPGSLLNFYRRLLKLRATEEALLLGEYTPLDAPDEVLAFQRGSEQDGLLIAINFRKQAVTWPIPGRTAEVLLSTVEPDRRRSSEQLCLKPNEGVVARLSAVG